MMTARISNRVGDAVGTWSSTASNSPIPFKRGGLPSQDFRGIEFFKELYRRPIFYRNDWKTNNIADRAKQTNCLRVKRAEK